MYRDKGAVLGLAQTQRAPGIRGDERIGGEKSKRCNPLTKAGKPGVGYDGGWAKMRIGKTEQLMPPVHPGEILREDFMKPLGLSVNKLALELHVPATRIGEIVHERRRITAETALRLARYFKTNAEFWLNLQNFYDLEVTKRSGKESEIERQVQPVGADVA
jgi:antitoxin HigA-1